MEYHLRLIYVGGSCRGLYVFVGGIYHELSINLWRFFFCCFQLARFVDALRAMEAVLGRRKGTADDYVLRAKIRWAMGMVRARLTVIDSMILRGGNSKKGSQATRKVAQVRGIEQRINAATNILGYSLRSLGRYSFGVVDSLS